MKSEPICLDESIEDDYQTFLTVSSMGRVTISQYDTVLHLNPTETKALIHALNTNTTDK